MRKEWQFEVPFSFIKTQVKWTDKFVNDNILIIESNYQKFPNRNRWSCNCHVIHDNDFDVDQIDFLFLRNEYKQIIKNLFDKTGITNDFYMSDIWYNYYKLGQYQEPHTHDSTFTVVHYLILSETDSKTSFTNKNIQEKSLSVEQGDLIMFPGWYEHEVLPSKFNTNRLTIAFGVTLIS